MKQQNTKEIILTIVVGLLVFFFIFLPKGVLAAQPKGTLLQGLLIAALGIGVLSIFSNFVAEKIAWVWLKFAEILGRVNSTVLLSLIFFIFLTPIALLMRIFKKGDALKLKKPATASAYDERNHTYVKKDLENTW
ncbi:SxtJ family membrane protein [Emticicia fontis]